MVVDRIVISLANASTLYKWVTFHESHKAVKATSSLATVVYAGACILIEEVRSEAVGIWEIIWNVMNRYCVVLGITRCLTCHTVNYEALLSKVHEV